ncbi:DUF2637 domain-containing protein [Streptomyces sp. NPDC088766]|uniref:DUF2637 domain-containing protein n=1 Tax=Streptomyces sp. NPDC088766 TaxID=3365893 RepID=UPI0037F6F3E1
MDRSSNNGPFSTQHYVPRAGEGPGGRRYDSIPFPIQQSWDGPPHAGAWDNPPHAGAWDGPPYAGAWDSSPYAGVRDSPPHATVWDSPPPATAWDDAPPATVWESAPHAAVLDGWDPDEELAAMLSPAQGRQSSPDPLERSHHRRERRRKRRQEPDPPAGRRITHATLLIAAIFVCAACLLGWSVAYTYGQLRVIAEGMLPDAVAQWWPLAVYGPWFVAALSILRATVQHRRARRSWSVLLTASAVAAALCVGHSSRSLMAFVMFGMPPVTALVCFWELIGQISSRKESQQAAHAQRSPGT